MLNHLKAWTPEEGKQWLTPSDPVRTSNNANLPLLFFQNRPLLYVQFKMGCEGVRAKRCWSLTTVPDSVEFFLHGLWGAVLG
jgi:hypothetical protein